MQKNETHPPLGAHSSGQVLMFEGQTCSHFRAFTTRNRVNYSHQRSGEVRAEVCLCGTPLVRFKGRRPKRYCSDWCHQHAYRKRQTPVQQPSLPVLATTHLGSSRPFAHHQRKRGTYGDTKQVNCSPQGSGGVKGETCPCGTPLVQSLGGRMREYCSDRCRQRAYRERQTPVQQHSLSG